MTPTLQFILALATLIAVARLGGALSKRLGQPDVVGALVAGVLLGPSLFNFFHLSWFTDPHLGDSIQYLAELGVILLMFVAGLEIDFDEMVKIGRPAILAGTGGVIATIALGFMAGLFFQLPTLISLFLGIALSATSVGISAQTLMELGVLRRRESLTLLGAAVIDDLLGLLALSVFLALTRGAGGGLAGVLFVFARLGAFLIVAAVVSLRLIPRATVWVERLPIDHGLLSFVMVVVLFYAWTAEAIGGIAAITGSFLAGLAFARTSLRREIEHNFSGLTRGFLVPLFFVSIGLHANVRNVTWNTLLFVLVLVIVMVVSKTVGCGLGAWGGGLTRNESLRLGIGMIAQGEVVLIVATIGLTQKLIGETLFAEIVLVVLSTTLLTPLLLSWAYARAGGEREQAKEKLPSQRQVGE